MRAAFFDLDGTLTGSNVVTRYLYFARRRPERWNAIRSWSAAVLGLPYWILLDKRSRLKFNEEFYRQYRGLRESWLREEAEGLFQWEIKPKIYPGSQYLLDRDRAEGFKLVLVTGGLSFAIEPAARYLGFDFVLSNHMCFENGCATGELKHPILAEAGKVRAIEEFCRDYNVNVEQSKAYSDSFSDLPMLEAAGIPAAVNPDERLLEAAKQRGWTIVDTKRKR